MLNYFHVDVFSDTNLSGNGLSVVIVDHILQDDHMLKISQEFKQFETIFLKPSENLSNPINARIFTLDEELAFAGHPILGAAAVIHNEYYKSNTEAAITFSLQSKQVDTVSRRAGNHYWVQMNQGNPQYLYTPNSNQIDNALRALNLSKENLDTSLPPEVITTGLPYLLIPLKSGIEKARISVPNFEQLLSSIKAKFVYVFDTHLLEARTWENTGIVEDVATGSAAGPLCAYLIRHNRLNFQEKVIIRQGKYIDRPSCITAWMDNPRSHSGNVYISGEVAFFAKGQLL